MVENTIIPSEMWVLGFYQFSLALLTSVLVKSRLHNYLHLIGIGESWCVLSSCPFSLRWRSDSLLRRLPYIWSRGCIRLEQAEALHSMAIFSSQIFLAHCGRSFCCHGVLGVIDQYSTTEYRRRCLQLYSFCYHKSNFLSYAVLEPYWPEIVYQGL